MTSPRLTSPRNLCTAFWPLFRFRIIEGSKQGSQVQQLLDNLQQMARGGAFGDESVHRLQQAFRKFFVGRQHGDWNITFAGLHLLREDRKSTRLNSSHVAIS